MIRRLARFSALLVALAICALPIPAMTDGAPEKSMPIHVKDSYALLVDASGKPLTPERTYSNIYSITEGEVPAGQELFAAASLTVEGDEVLFAVMDAQGKLLTGYVYQSLIYDAKSGLISFYQNELTGLMDRDMNLVVPPEYTNLVPNGQGGYLALRTSPYDETPDGVYCLDAQGNETATGVKIISSMYTFQDGLCAAMSPDGGRYGYLNAEGRWEIQPQYSWAGDFLNGYAVANMDSGSGIIDKSGNWALTPKYTSLDVNVQDQQMPIIAVKDNTTIYLLDRASFNTIATFTGDDIYGYSSDNGYIVLTMDDSVALVDKTGKVLSTLSSQGYFNTWGDMGGLVILSDGTWGDAICSLYDVANERTVAGPYQELMLLGTTGGAPYFAFSTYRTREYNDEYSGTSFLTEVPGTRRTGIVDKAGKEVLPAQYDTLYQLADNRFWAETATRTGIIDLSGKWIIGFDRYSELMD